MISRCLRLFAVFAVATAYVPPNLPKPALKPNNQFDAVKAAAATAFAVIISTAPLPAFASPTAGQISLNSIPPSSVQLDIKDLPVVGNLLSGTYTKVADNSIKNPSVVIRSPKDKVAAIKSAATGGHLDFDVNGVLRTHLDVDVAADKAGVATVRVASPLIPKLPFKNQASATPVVSGKKASDWSSVTNLGNGETYYFNGKTDITQFEKPAGF